MGSFLGAIIALCGVLIAGYLSNFVAEDYRRFRDGSSLAAALSGELKSYMQGAEAVLPMLANMIKVVLELSDDKRIPVDKFEVPPDPVFDSAVKQLGLLGPDLAFDVAYVYQQLRAFRKLFAIFTENHASWENARTFAHLKNCEFVVNRTLKHGVPLIDSLRARSAEQYVPPNPRVLIAWRTASGEGEQR